MKTVICLISLLVSSISFADEVKPCRYELTTPQFFIMRMGEKPPDKNKSPDIIDMALDAATELLEDYVGVSIVGVIEAGAFATSSTKYFAEMYVLYSYRFIHNNKPTTQWEKVQQKVMNGNIDFFTAGTDGVNDAKRAKEEKLRSINRFLQKELEEQCKNHQN